MKDSQLIYKLLKRIASPEETLLAHEELATVIKLDWALVVPEITNYIDIAGKNKEKFYDHLCYWATGVFGRLLRARRDGNLDETLLRYLGTFLKSESAMVRRYAAVQLVWSNHESVLEGCVKEEDEKMIAVARAVKDSPESKK